MTVSLIRHDARVIGVASAEPTDQGLGVLTWFHNNVHAYSMDHATKHEGYSVDAPAELDCGDVESIIGAICERAGVTMEATFVPFTQSRNAKGAKPWRSLNWAVTIKRAGRVLLTTDYSQGEGHVPNPDKLISGCYDRNNQIRDAMETGKFTRAGSMVRRVNIEAPSIGAVVQALVNDAGVLDAGGFEEWASDLGYDTDSQSAEATYNACVEIATKLRAGLGVSLMTELRLAAQYN